MSEQTVNDAGAVVRSPITPTPPVRVHHGWEVSERASDAALTIVDETPLAKVQIKVPWNGRAAAGIGVSFGRAERDSRSCLVIGSGPGEWLVLGDPGTQADLVVSWRDSLASGDELVTVLDLTHGRALIRLRGADTARLLSKLCAIDLADTVAPNGAAFRSSVARLVTDVVRDDAGDVPSYLLHCERSSGQYLFDALLDAGAEFGIEVDGFGRTAIAAGAVADIHH